MLTNGLLPFVSQALWILSPLAISYRPSIAVGTLTPLRNSLTRRLNLLRRSYMRWLNLAIIERQNETFARIKALISREWVFSVFCQIFASLSPHLAPISLLQTAPPAFNSKLRTSLKQQIHYPCDSEESPVHGSAEDIPHELVPFSLSATVWLIQYSFCHPKLLVGIELRA